MMYKDQEKLENLLFEEINRRERLIDVLFFFSYKNNLIPRVIKETKARITLISTDQEIEESNKVDNWSEDPFKFLDLAIETQTKFDIILLINPEEYFDGRSDIDFKDFHKEFFRTLQMKLLNQGGVIIFSTHKEGFQLNQYIKPGADKLTKQVLTKEEREESHLQAYAFYA